MPADATRYTLAPGSVLYVPRGFLHHVTSVSDEDSLSLNLCFPPTPWAVILCTLLSTRLLEHAEFRHAVTGAFGSGWGREEFFRRLPGIMKEFCRHAQAIDYDLREILEDSGKLREYLARRRYPML
jgi:ribosomal protein L16 Arg81 hydroxylase